MHTFKMYAVVVFMSNSVIIIRIFEVFFFGDKIILSWRENRLIEKCSGEGEKIRVADMD